MPQPSASLDAADSHASSTWRTLFTLLLVIHLFFMALAVSASFAPSSLQSQLLLKFRFYTRLLNFELGSPRAFDFGAPRNSPRFFLTHAQEGDVDHRIEVLPVGKRAEVAEDWIVLPTPSFRGLDSYKRYQRLGAAWAAESQFGDPARYAQAVGTHFARQRATVPMQVRCRRHFLQSPEDIGGGTPARQNPEDPSFFGVVYAANAIASPDGYVEVIRVDEASQVAQPVSPNRSGGREVNAKEPRPE